MAKRTKKQLAEGCMEAGTKVTMSAQGVTKWGSSYANPEGVTGTVTEDLPPTYGGGMQFVVRVAWPDGSTNSYQKGDLDVVTEVTTKGYDLYVVEAADGGEPGAMHYDLRTEEEVDTDMTHDAFVLVKKASIEDVRAASWCAPFDENTGVWNNPFYGALVLVERVNEPELQQWVEVSALNRVH